MLSVPLRQNSNILTMAAKVKGKYIRDLIPQGIIYGLKNKGVAKYLRNPLEHFPSSPSPQKIPCLLLLNFLGMCTLHYRSGYKSWLDDSSDDKMCKKYICAISSKLPSKWMQYPNKPKRADKDNSDKLRINKEVVTLRTWVNSLFKKFGLVSI